MEISLHRFASNTGAVSALPYFAESRAEARGLSLISTELLPPGEAAVVGKEPEGNEATIYVRLDNVLARVTVIASDGPAETVARQVVNGVIAKRAQLTAG